MDNDTVYKNVVLRKNSRYTQGGLTDRYPRRVGWWERYDLPRDITDLRITVLPNEAGRPDLISYRIYQTPAYMWLVLQYNAIVDPIVELKVGDRLILPIPQRLSLEIMTKSTGGNRV